MVRTQQDSGEASMEKVGKNSRTSEYGSHSTVDASRTRTVGLVQAGIKV